MSQRRWIAAAGGAVTFLHDFTTVAEAGGQQVHVEFTAAYGVAQLQGLP